MSNHNRQKFIKPSAVLLAIAGVFMLTSLTLDARIGEDIKQCESRYGETLFKNTKGDLEYRSYKFKGKAIRVVFYKSESVMEQVVSGPHAISSSDQGAGFSADFALFFRGLLQGTYHFTDKQVQDITEWKQTERFSFGSGDLENGDLVAKFWANTTESQDSIKLFGIICKRRAELSGLSVGDFLTKSMTSEAKAREIERSNGF